MDKELKHIVNNFNTLGEDFVIGNRNLIKLFPYNDEIVAIKSFKRPNLISAIIYRFFRKSKAERSFSHAKVLESKNIGTPKPIAYHENTTFWKLLDTYYICEHLKVDYVFKDLFYFRHEDLDNILQQLARFTFELHENGIEFLDHSPGNTLIKKVSDTKYQFYLVDLNRMRFHKTMSLEQRAKNFARLTPSEYMIMIMSHEYASLIKEDKEYVFNLFWKETQQFMNKANRKERIKKRVLFWKK